MPLFPKIREDTNQERSDRIDMGVSMKRAERITHAQQHLTMLINEGRYDEYIRYATGVYPADIAADRIIRVN